jgi:hypothetical protein
MTENPTDAILDDADLRTIRDALKEGKQVKLLPDGSLEVSPDVVDAPMGARAEAYIESQLGDVKTLLEQGFEMHVHPAGQVFGASADGLTRMQGDLDVGLGSEDLLTIKVVLGMGANVAVLPDGTVRTQHHLDQSPRGEQEVNDLMAAIDRHVADGSLATEARAGRGLTIADAGDGGGTQLRFAQSAADAPGIALPDDPAAPAPAGSTPAGEPGGENIPEDPTGVDLADLADRIDARADALRADALEDQVAESSRVGLERDASAREAWMAQQGHEAAWQQARRELKMVQDETKQVQDLEARARASEATHSPAHVEDLRQSAASHQARLDIARQRMESAEAEANRLGEEAAAHRNFVTVAEERLTEITTQSTERVRFADMLETQASQVRSASEAMAAGNEEQARGWLTDARVVGAGETEPTDVIPDEPAGAATTPSSGPVTDPSAIDDVTGADAAPAPAEPAPAADEAPAEQPADQPVEQPTDQPAEQPAEQPAAPSIEQPAASSGIDGLELGLQAADSIEADLSFDAPAPAEPEPQVDLEAAAPAEPADVSVLDG